jgi:hypothetical protein
MNERMGVATDMPRTDDDACDFLLEFVFLKSGSTGD